MFRFLHAADIHLDSPMKGLSRYEGAPVERMRHATRRAFENLVQTAIDQGVAFVLIAGDVFDGDWPDYNTGLFFVKQLQVLREAGISVYLIRGNHDAASQITKSLRLPDNVHEFSYQKASTIEHDGCPVAIHGQSFGTRAVKENLALGYPALTSGLFNIGLLHTCATGREGHESYAPCKTEDLINKEYDYWALGHIHQRELLHSSPIISFSGNLQGRSVRETGAKGCELIEVGDDQTIKARQFVPLDVARWERLNIDASRATSLDHVFDRVAEELKHALSLADGRLLAIRTRIFGRTDIHAKLQADRSLVINELRSIANSMGEGEVWLEKLSLRTEASSAVNASSHSETLMRSSRRNVLDSNAVDPSDLEWLATSDRESGPWSELAEVCQALLDDPSQAEAIGCSLDDLARRLPGEIQDRMDLKGDDLRKRLVGEAASRLVIALQEKGDRS